METLARAYGRITEADTTLDNTALVRPTRCTGWSLVDLLFHVLFDAQRALVTFASPAAGPADVDCVTYWSAFKPDRGRLVPARLVGKAFSVGVHGAEWRRSLVDRHRATGSGRSMWRRTRSTGC
jgi:Mycothiol maleylpyruvate isomerase N-terminal domain